MYYSENIFWNVLVWCALTPINKVEKKITCAAPVSQNLRPAPGNVLFRFAKRFPDPGVYFRIFRHARFLGLVRLKIVNVSFMMFFFLDCVFFFIILNWSDLENMWYLFILKFLYTH